MKKLTEGNPLTLMLTFAIPILLGNIFQQLYTMVDLIIVSKKLGTGALASVGATQSLTGLLFSFIHGLTNGFCIIIAQYFGAGKNKDMKRSISVALSLSLLLTVFFTIVSLSVLDRLFLILNTPVHLIPDAKNYISILIYGLIFTMLYNLLASVLRAVGNSVAPLVFLIISAALNIGLDLLFVMVFQWGIQGAAAATVLSQAFSAFLCFLYIMKKSPEIHISGQDFDFSPSLVVKMLSTGFSMALMYSIVSIGSVILQSGINGLGEKTIAAHTTARKLLELFMMPLTTISAASSTFSSQNYGAGLYHRVFEGVKKAFLLCFIWSTLACLIIFPFAEPLIVLIGEESDSELIGLAKNYLYISIPFYYALSVLVVLRNVLQGMGRRILPLFISGTELFGKILAIRLLVPALGYLGVCLTEPIIWVVDAILVFIYFLIVKQKYKNPNPYAEP